MAVKAALNEKKGPDARCGRALISRFCGNDAENYAHVAIIFVFLAAFAGSAAHGVDALFLRGLSLRKSMCRTLFPLASR